MENTAPRDVTTTRVDRAVPDVDVGVLGDLRTINSTLRALEVKLGKIEDRVYKNETLALITNYVVASLFVSVVAASAALLSSSVILYKIHSRNRDFIRNLENHVFTQINKDG